MGMGKGEEKVEAALKHGGNSSDFGLCKKRKTSEGEHSDEMNEKRRKIDKYLREASVLRENQALKGDAPRRLQVLWDVESDGTTESFWWSCELVADGHDINEQGKVVCTLKDEPVCDAAGTLTDLENEENMLWRFETDDDMLKNVLSELGTEVVNLSDVVAVQSHLQPGNAEDGAMMDALKSLPMNQQLSFAEGFRTLADKLKEKLKDLQDSKKANGEDLVINERDVKGNYNPNDESQIQPNYLKALIGKRWLAAAEGSGGRSTFGVTSPYSGKEIARLLSANISDAVNAIDLAKSELPSWWKLGPHGRQNILRRWEALIQENREDLSVLISSESGKPLTESRGEIAYAASYISLYADMASTSAGGEVLPSQPSQRSFAIRRPVGVCAMITPFNFPAAMITRKVAPALAAGCTCVIKPAEQTPLTALALVELGLQAGIPEGVLSVLPSSRDIGICIIYRVNDRWKDADLDAAAQGVLLAKFRYGGQTCVCANRCIVEESIADEFVQKVIQLLSTYRLGDPLHPETQMGPMINVDTVERMRRMVKNAQDMGASMEYGGEGIYSVHPLGELFVSPVILKGCNMDMECCDNEMFGPILPVMTFREEEEAVSIANGVKQGGLAGYVFTSSVPRGMRVAESLEVGMVGINDAAISSAHIPFGGIGEAGIGREGGPYGLDDYMEIQYLCVSK